MTTTETTTLDAQIEARCKALVYVYEHAPDMQDAPTPRQAERVYVERSLATQRWHGLEADKRLLAEARTRVAEHTPWLDTLKAAKAKFEPELAALEAVPQAMRSSEYYRQRDALTEALKHIRVGPEWLGSICVIAPPLIDYLHAAGWSGNPFAGRGGLFSTEARLLTFQRALAVVTANIEKELATPLPPPITF